MTKLSYEYIKSQFDLRGYTLISKEYLNAKMPLEYICPIHKDKGIQMLNWNNFQQGIGCKACGINKRSEKRRKTSIDLIKNEMLKKDMLLLSTDYINNHTPLEYKCIIHCDQIQKISWSNFKKGEGCRYCAFKRISDLKRKNYDDVKKVFDELGYILISSEYIQNDIPLEFICELHIEKGIQKIDYSHIQQGSRCKFCTKERVKKEISGENSRFWKGGISSLGSYLRCKIKQWKIDSLKSYGYKCIVTGKKDIEIHHLFSFSNILKETMDDLNIPVKNKIIKYSEEELYLIESSFLFKHYEYGLGIPLSKEIHREFHTIYGKGNNTPGQFYEFMKLKGINFKSLNLKEVIK